MRHLQLFYQCPLTLARPQRTSLLQVLLVRQNVTLTCRCCSSHVERESCGTALRRVNNHFLQSRLRKYFMPPFVCPSVRSFFVAEGSGGEIGKKRRSGSVFLEWSFFFFLSSWERSLFSLFASLLLFVVCAFFFSLAFGSGLNRHSLLFF
ncbi:hypothetical protein BDB00DRAFT_845473 [Zychaea mexicana]|uniref:uncharacterized protein n=1 Tax=Zychaea mexicana TaxID=64656 RepID=UPI0022FEE2AC|nr:uncharacterized protein BDB00DRAFT_845473 [Zychaea mexicana]KAI9489046.1 hypothetical protein BDB00DRAFT_845473 [Zychaea mexicana]